MKFFSAIEDNVIVSYVKAKLIVAVLAPAVIWRRSRSPTPEALVQETAVFEIQFVSSALVKAMRTPRLEREIPKFNPKRTKVDCVRAAFQLCTEDAEGESKEIIWEIDEESVPAVNTNE
jgi:hypothetical protein